MADISEVKALAFDVFGTTVDWCSGIARAAREMLAPKGYTLDWTRFAVQWRREYQPAMEKVRSGARGYVWMDVLHREMLDAPLREFHVEGLSEDEKQWLALGWRRLDPWPDVIEGMQRMKKKLILVACSNANIALAVEMAKRGGLPWDLILGAEPVRMYKPRGEVYDSVGQFLGLKPHNVAMVACHPWDLDGAAGRGLRTLYVRRPDEYGPGVGSEKPAPGRYDLMTDSFVDLAEKLGA
jgi:2-haloacid dehalogenase